MICHPLFAGFVAPRSVSLGPYVLHVLGPDDVEEDFRAVTESEDRLIGLMGGDWPKGLTLEENRIDLCWHFREFATNRSFAWIVRDDAGRYMGCAYVFPDFGAEPSATVSLWIRSTRDPEVHEAAFGTLFMDWLNGPDWPTMNYVLNVSD